MREVVQWTRPTGSDTTQTHIFGIGLAYLNIYDLLECMKELVLTIDILRNSMILSNSRISKRSFSEGPVIMVCQRPET